MQICVCVCVCVCLVLTLIAATGLLVGGIAKAAGGEVVDALRFPDTIFLFVLLPPIILDSAITIRKVCAVCV